CASERGRSRGSSPTSVGGRDHLPAAVGAAGGTDLVAEGRLVTGGATRDVGGGNLPMRPALQLLLPGCALLRGCHGKLLQSCTSGVQPGPERERRLIQPAPLLVQRVSPSTSGWTGAPPSAGRARGGRSRSPSRSGSGRKL